MEKRWVIKEESNSKTITELSESINVSPQIADLLIKRGIDNFEKAKSFFRPSLDEIHDPFLMLNMQAAVDRIELAFQNSEKILIYGDYDVDGTTAVALVYSFFKNYYEELDFYIPDRYKEGYGVSIQGIDYAAENDFTLIISLDCGIKAVEKIEYAKEKGIDFIICDHHRPGEIVPNAIVLDPKQNDCTYPYKELCGCGVGFKLVQAFSIQNEIEFSELEPLFDLLVVSIAADIVPITGENRILAYYGLQRVNSNPRKGFETILELANKNGKCSVTDLVFLISPRINAAGRMKSGKEAVKLLISYTEDQAKEAALSIDKYNVERRSLDKATTQEALKVIEESDELKKAKSTVVYNENWHKGVVGIVASRLTETYYRPTIVLTKSGDKIAGSARSVKGFDVYNAIEACKDELLQFGGHKYAAGLTLKPEQISGFRQKFEEVVSSSITKEQLIPQIDIDGTIDFSDIYENNIEVIPKFYRIIEQFGPFGPKNMRPVFKTNGVTDTGYGKIVGDNHLKLTLSQPDNPDLKFSAIAFNLGEFITEIKAKTPLNIVYTIERNEWNGRVSLQLNIKDIKIST